MLVAVASREMVANWEGHKNAIVSSHYLAVPSEDIEVYMHAVVTVIFRVCKLVRLL